MHFEVGCERNCDIAPVLFDHAWGQSVLAVGRHLLVHMRADDASTASAWVAPRNEKRAETRNLKKISKRNLPNVGMVDG